MRRSVIGGLGLGLGLAISTSAAIAADRSMEAVSACAPSTIEEAVDCLIRHAPDDAMTVLRVDPELGVMALDHVLRRAWKLPDGGPLPEMFRAQNIVEPGEMTRLVLRAYLRKTSGCTADWNEIADWHGRPLEGCPAEG